LLTTEPIAGRPPQRLQILDVESRHALERVVMTGRPGQRANPYEFVGDRGELGQVLAQLEAGQRRLDGRELAANFDGGLGLQVDHVHVRRTTIEVHVDDRLVR
jgi:hypothetical protein